MTDAIIIYPDWNANYKNYLYYIKRQNNGKIKENNSKCAGRGQQIMPYLLYEPNLKGFHPYNIITEETL